MKLWVFWSNSAYWYWNWNVSFCNYLFDDLKKQQDNCLYNLSIIWENSSKLIDRIEIEIFSRKLNKIIISIWEIDCLSDKNHKNIVSFDKFEFNIIKLYEIWSTYTKNISFIWLFKNPDKSLVIQNEKYNIDINNIIKYNDYLNNCCQAYWIEFIDIFNKINSSHIKNWYLNDKWHKIVYETLKQQLF